MIYAKSRKGRGYHVFDEKSHGVQPNEIKNYFFKIIISFIFF